MVLEKRKSLQRRFLIFCAWGIRRRRRTREALLCTAQQGSERHGGGGVRTGGEKRVWGGIIILCLPSYPMYVGNMPF